VKITRDMGGMTPAAPELASTALAGGIKTDSETMSSLREFVTNPVVVKAVIEEVIRPWRDRPRLQQPPICQKMMLN
jgi:hypothetical protein